MNKTNNTKKSTATKKSTTRKKNTTKKSVTKKEQKENLEEKTLKKTTSTKNKTTSAAKQKKSTSTKSTNKLHKTSTANKKTKTIKKRAIKPTTKKNIKKSVNTKSKSKNKKEKNNKLVILLFISLLLIISFQIIYNYYLKAPNLSIIKVFLNDNEEVIIKYKRNNFSFNNKVYCIITELNNTPNINDSKWFLTTNNECVYKLDENIYNVYLKNKNGKIFKVNGASKIGLIKNLKINNEFDYLPVNDSLILKVSYDKLGYVDDTIEWSSSDSKIATVKDGKVYGKESGTVIISAKVQDKTITSKIVVTNLITKRTNYYDNNKKELKCNIYSKEDNDLLDNILKFKIEKVGYKTRAAVVEAARFLTLDFPYKINYFYENGRLTKNGVDGEGRYYHKGLYLDESRYSSIKKSKKGPKTWGCPLYSVPDKQKDNNGLDCSGFVSWALLNGGFDSGDIGAGITKVKDLTDLGVKKKITTSLAISNKIKVGDLLHNTWSGGHIAIIVGIDKTYYYVAQAVWFDNVGVIISKYKKSDLKNKFKEVILMDKYYKKDGDITNMW